MKSIGRQKHYSREALADRWIRTVTLVWAWEAVFWVCAIWAHLEQQRTGELPLIYLAVILMLVGPMIYLLYRYFYRIITANSMTGPGWLGRVVTAWGRGIVGWLTGAAVILLTGWLADVIWKYLPVALAWGGITLTGSAMRLFDWLVSTPLWWPLAVVVAIFFPVATSQWEYTMIANPQIDPLTAWRHAWKLIKNNYLNYYKLFFSFWLGAVAVCLTTWGMIEYARAGLHDLLGLETEIWVWLIALGLALAPLLTYMLGAFINFFVDADEDFRHAQKVQPKTVSEWKEETPSRTREEIQASMLESMRRRAAQRQQVENGGAQAPQEQAQTPAPMPAPVVVNPETMLPASTMQQASTSTIVNKQPLEPLQERQEVRKKHETMEDFMS